MRNCGHDSVLKIKLGKLIMVLTCIAKFAIFVIEIISLSSKGLLRINLLSLAEEGIGGIGLHKIEHLSEIKNLVSLNTFWAQHLLAELGLLRSQATLRINLLSINEEGIGGIRLNKTEHLCEIQNLVFMDTSRCTSFLLYGCCV
ncbi:hypothetical protein EV14_2499 [Prochlorococcus sp. MIT 0703]|nr:hypothetical protein EV14_2499 [Prochlorococcus sp. MIT 0703]